MRDPHGMKFTFGFLPPAAWGTAAAAHKFWLAEWNRSRGTKGKGVSVERLRGFGADDAFGIETTYQDPKPHTDTTIRWVKGGYEGGVEVLRARVRRATWRTARTCSGRS